MKIDSIFLLVSCLLTVSFAFKGPNRLKFRRNHALSLNSKGSTGLLVGSAGLITLLLNRLYTGLEAVSDGQSRADLIAVVATSGVLLDWLSNQEVQRRERDPVPLAGYALRAAEISPTVQETARPVMKWLTDSILAINFISSVHVVLNKEFIVRNGVIGYDDRNATYDIAKFPILADAISSRKQVYLPDLQILPGKVEFAYLPLNCQSVLILPLKDLRGVIIVGTNKAKCFDFKDIEKIAGCIELFETEYMNRLRWSK